MLYKRALANDYMPPDDPLIASARYGSNQYSHKYLQHAYNKYSNQLLELNEAMPLGQ